MSSDDLFHVWFDDEQVPRSRQFADADEARRWASSNRPHHRYKVVREPVALLRRLRAKLGLLHITVEEHAA